MTSAVAVDMSRSLLKADLVPFFPAELAQDRLLQDDAEPGGAEAIAAARRQQRLMAALQPDQPHALPLGRIADQHGAGLAGRRRRELHQLDLDLAIHAERDFNAPTGEPRPLALRAAHFLP